MKVAKVINNNLICSHNEGNKEILVMGCGLGFKKKPGDEIDTSLIEKVYTIEDEKISNQLIDLLSRIPQDHIRVANNIVGYAKEVLEHKLNDSIYVSLTDHLNYAIERHKQGIHLKNALLWEIKKYYSKEFEVGIEALHIIEKQLGIQLPEDEAGYIALHVASASMEAVDMGHTTDTLKMIQGILQIVKYYFKIELDTESLHYERFLTHLKFLSLRIHQDKHIEGADDYFIKLMKEHYKNEYDCALKIGNYIHSNYSKSLTDEELVYLTVHINRITHS
ncbi:transcription antiterminator LicT [Anaerocolumna cellulosilytica]|uniref:Transcription antiterminator LicT n=1 Tax=Anaerocolumna cellulosilytica TaxID=433286 RepID=A0A6S6R4C1_9FIRM|nr:PRD domain-containing protein [Anaerocolumna cellulosilytica]MBB5194706.1 beta-glucoside operon transcriptional antiterminator [Anaerocolumna cellulosilytica]BCJ94332.1 transcription antiterminator LicT [Anaerocolumna cellulosilytica]